MLTSPDFLAGPWFIVLIVLVLVIGETAIAIGAYAVGRAIADAFAAFWEDRS